jgi:hypothetical protein
MISITLFKGEQLMKAYLLFSVLLLAAFTASAKDNLNMQVETEQNYHECVAVSLFSMQGRELNSAARGNNLAKETNFIPEGWSVVGVTEKSEAGVTAPYLVICR